MPPVSKLMDLQDLDLAADELHEKRRTLPARAALVESQRHAAALDQGLDLLDQQRKAARSAEHALGDEVSTVASKAAEVEGTLYSGSVKSPKELEGLQEELRLLKAKQAGLEDRELELMEEIERTEAEIERNREQRTGSDALEEELCASIVADEGEIDEELATNGSTRQQEAADIPSAVLEKYAELRGKKRLAGRGAALLRDGSCQGCRMKLAVFEHNRIQGEPPEALVRCTHCNRILVR
jgi:predicted  nucleic acid-binding Zn-ribbon protein